MGLPMTVWLLMCTAVEIRSVYRLLLGSEAVDAVVPIYSLVDPIHWPTTLHMVFIMGMLMAGRVGPLLYSRDKGSWALCAAIHVAEAVFFGYLLFGTTASNRSLQRFVGLARQDADQPAVQGIALYAIICCNACLFTGRWLLAVGKASGSTAGGAGDGAIRGAERVKAA